MAIEINQLFIYPVKSLRGIAVSSAELTATGFKWDRHWMITKPDGGFLTQRQFPKMVLIQPQLTADSIILSKTGMNDLIIPFKNTGEAGSTDTITDAKVWKDSCKVVDEGEAASAWITQAINAPKALRLVRMASGHRRPQSRPKLLGEATHTLFADAAPILICNVDSLKALNSSLIKQQFDPVEMDNFRPNIVLKGLDAFYEHTLKGLHNEHYELKHCYPCQRCIIPTINVYTGIKNPQQEPFSLLAKLNAMPDNKKAPAFGENTIVTQGIGERVSVGDRLKCLQDS
ncbi:MAG: hypothetical protein ACJA1S_001173 [Cellvibrionaceae bacterium]|jgi:uncharacterized protein YcbX